MRTIRRIFVHCTGGSQSQTVQGLLRYFRVEKHWKNPGYHYVVSADGTVTQLLDESKVSNGVKGYNPTSINIAWMGGLKGTDNRTDAQCKALVNLLRLLRKRYPKAEILGHRDISPDTNHNGIIDAWERIKECPCFDAKKEYKDI